MKVLLLLAGRSRRFWPLGDKTLFPICGKTILEHQVDRLNAAGLRDITFVGSAQNLEDVRRLFPKAKTAEQRDLDLGMQGALLASLPACGKHPVLIVGGNDVVEPAAYKKTVGAMKGGVDGAMLGKEVTRYFPGGYLTLKGNRITGVKEKPGEGNEPSNLVTIVVHAHRDASELLRTLKETSNEKDDGYERALQLLCSKKNYIAVPYSGFWQPVKYPWHILPLLDYLLGTTVTKRKIHRTATVHKTAVIDGPVFIDEGAEVFAHATIRGPAYIGKRAIVANNALVRGASIGDDSIVGFSTEVKASALQSHVWTHMSYIGDSVIGKNVSFGAGAVTGNLRLDEGEIHSHHGETKLPTGLSKFGTVIGEGCRIGIHTGINPGVKIGAGTFVSSGVLVTHDVPDRSYVSTKDGEMMVRENRTAAPSLAHRASYKKKVSGKKGTKGR